MSNNSQDIVRAALYARVSTDDQRERQTIGNQIDALRGFAPHSGLTIVDEYLDDGISGTVPLENRPEGHRMAQDAKDGKLDVIIFYKLDRLARSLRNFLDIVDFAAEVGVGLRSMTEPFDTTNPMGRFAVQMMAAVAELERGTILERTMMGRARIASQGKWTGGMVPYGYLVDTDGHLTPDRTPRNGYSFSEAEIVQRIYHELADEKRSAEATARKLNADGIPMWHKYHGRSRQEPTYRSKPGAIWQPTNITRIIRSSTYKGTHVWGKKDNQIERDVPALVELETWELAQRQLDANKRLSARPNDLAYLLRGLITCTCGRGFTGATFNTKDKAAVRYYRCGSQAGDKLGRERCNAKVIDAQWIEDKVWEDIKTFVANPGDVINTLKDRMDQELKSVPPTESRRRELTKAIDAKEAEKDRVLDAYRRGLIDIDALSDHVGRSKIELEPLQEELANLTVMVAQTGLAVGQMTNAEHLLAELKDQIQGDLDWDTRRQVIEALVKGVTVVTKGEGRKKTADMVVTYAFAAPVHAVEQGMSSSTDVYSMKMSVGVTHTKDYFKPVGGILLNAVAAK